jgi:4-aminobutyrate aminotransferase-like enzyme
MPYTRNTKPGPLSIQRGEAEFFYDPDGRRYLDFCSQTLNLGLGHSHPRVKEAVIEALDQASFVSSRFGNDFVSRLVERVAKLAPPPLSHVNLKLTSGTLANEGALKAAFKYRKRTGVVSLIGSHHGQSLATMRVSGKNFDKAYVDRNGVRFFEPPTLSWEPGLNDEAANASARDASTPICEWISRNHEGLGAIIVEPVMVDAGVIVLAPDFLKALRRSSDEYNVPLIFDEVQTAFGWTGRNFACEYSQVIPDALTACKGFASGFPLAALLVQASLDVLTYGEHEITHGASPLCCAAALASLDILSNPDLLSAVARRGSAFRAQLREELAILSFDHDVRGIGYISGVEFKDENTATRVYELCIEEGLVLRRSKVGERACVLQIKPPMITSEDSFHTAIEILAKATRTALAQQGGRR